MTLGQKIRSLRLGKKMTLQDVAGETGYSKALISRIENDSVSPSIGSLIKITTTLDITLHELFATVEGKSISIARKKDRSSQTLPGGKIRIEGLCDRSADSKLAAVIMTFDPGSSATDGSPRPGEEWWYMLKGKLEAVIGEMSYSLGEGDSMYLNSSVPHSWKNPAKGKAKALVLVTPAADNM